MGWGLGEEGATEAAGGGEGSASGALPWASLWADAAAAGLDFIRPDAARKLLKIELFQDQCFQQILAKKPEIEKNEAF